VLRLPLDGQGSPAQILGFLKDKLGQLSASGC
jgi:hypothetical protein